MVNHAHGLVDRSAVNEVLGGHGGWGSKILVAPLEIGKENWNLARGLTDVQFTSTTPLDSSHSYDIVGDSVRV